MNNSKKIFLALLILVIIFGTCLYVRSYIIENGRDVSGGVEITTGQNSIDAIAKAQKDKENSMSRIRRELMQSGQISKSQITTIPELPLNTKLFNPSRFVSGEIVMYQAGLEYTLVFEHKGTQDFDQFGTFYINEAKKNGFKLNTEIYAVNGTKVIYETESFEVRAVSYIKKDVDGTFFVKEKLTFYILN